MNNIKLSIIIPVYNVQDYIEDCLRSIMNQTMQEGVECIIVDDSSNDNSIKLSQKLISSYSGQIQFRTLRHKVNRGLSCARNTGIDASCGQYIGFVDSDDYIEPTMFEELTRLLDNTPNAQFVSSPIFEERDGKTTFFYGYEQYQLNSKLTIEEFFRLFLMHKIDNASWNKLYRKSFLQTLFKEHRNNEDFLFLYYNCKALIGTGDLVVLATNPYYHYRIHEGSICQQNPKTGHNALFFDILQNYREIILDLKTIRYEQKIIDSLDIQFRSSLYYNFYYVLLNKQYAITRANDVRQYWLDIKRIPISQIPPTEKSLTKEVLFIKFVPNGVRILSWIKSKIVS